jgi:hypothetical protein
MFIYEIADMFVLSGDSWDSYLIPEEPDPSYYDSFQHYEDAMLRFVFRLRNIFDSF